MRVAGGCVNVGSPRDAVTVSSSLSSTAPQRYRVYALADPRTGQPRYVGQTANTLPLRLRDHLRRRHDRSRKAAWLREVLDAGLQPRIVLLEEFTGSRASAYERESAWIRQLRDQGHDLTN